MRHTDRLFKTMSAAKICIAESLKSPSPHDSLAKYLSFLRTDPQWADDEIAEVEAAAKKALDAAQHRTLPSGNCGWSSESHPATPAAHS